MVGTSLSHLRIVEKLGTAGRGEVPLLDMVRQHGSPVAEWWVPEQGSSEDPA